jgi:ankyrin repeat protein
MTALTLAARDGQTEAVKFLLERGAAKDERKLDDAIMVAQMSRSGKREIVDLLQQARLGSVGPSTKGKSAEAQLITAAEKGDAAGVQAALKAGAKVNAQDDRGMQALSWAALRGHDAVVKILLDHGAEVNALNSSGWPPIGQACGQGKLDVVKTLISRGADVNLAFDGGRTALMCAAYQGHAAIVTELLKAGADKFVDYEGMTARDLAEQRGHDAIIALLG